MANQFEYSISDDLKTFWTMTPEHIEGFVAAIHSRLLDRPSRITVWLDTVSCVNSSTLKKMAEGLSRVMTIRDFEKKIIVFKRQHDETIPYEMNKYLEEFKPLMNGSSTNPFMPAEEASKQTERYREVSFQRHQSQIASQIKDASLNGKFEISYLLSDATICEVIVEELKDNGYNVDDDDGIITINWNIL